MRVGSAWRDACILDLSSRGLMIQSNEPLPGGSYLELRRGRHIIIARVMWSRDRRYGLRAQDALPCEAIIAEEDLADGSLAPPIECRAARAPAPRPFHHEQSRWRSQVLQFSMAILFGAVCGTFAYSAVSSALSRPLNAVQNALGGR